MQTVYMQNSCNAYLNLKKIINTEYIGFVVFLVDNK